MTWLGRRVKKSLLRFIFHPRLVVSKKHRIERLGSAYGGWAFVPDEALYGSLVISCGLGQDASFDIEIAAKYSATVIMIDPTPLAIKHFHEIKKNLGQPHTLSYSNSGRQEISSYDLASIKAAQLKLIPKALSQNVGPVKFYAPPNSNDVSHSIQNIHNSYSSDTPYIEVDSIDFSNLMLQLGQKAFELIKFDIEGAEIGVIPDMIRLGYRPKQILVEFDELNYPSRKSTAKFRTVDNLLKSVGYQVVYFDGRTCLSYRLEDANG